MKRVRPHVAHTDNRVDQAASAQPQPDQEDREPGRPQEADPPRPLKNNATNQLPEDVQEL